MFGPLNAVLADRVPDRQKGTVSALQGLALPTAGLFSALVLAMALDDLSERFLLTALAVPALVLPFALLVPDHSEPGPRQEGGRISLRVIAASGGGAALGRQASTNIRWSTSKATDRGPLTATPWRTGDWDKHRAMIRATYRPRKGCLLERPA